MPLFMMISGYVYAFAYFDSEGEPDRKRIYRQLGNIIAVYVLFSIPYGLIKVVFSRYTNKPVGLASLFLIFVKPIDLYWYLYDLVLLYLLFIIPIFRRGNQYIMTGLFMAAAFLSRYVTADWFQMSSTLYMALFFYIGFSGRYHAKWLIGNKRATLCAAVVGIILCFVFWNNGTAGDKTKVFYLNSVPVANMLIAGGTSLMLWYLFRNVRWLAENRFLALLGRHSLEIYVIHCCFTAGFRAVFPMIGVNDPFVSVLLNFVLSTAFSLAGAYICKLIGIHELIFKPVSFAMKSRKGNQGT